MNRERAKELLPIIIAFANGREIETLSSSTNLWIDAHNPGWHDGGYYRIKIDRRKVRKKARRKVWVHFPKGGAPGLEDRPPDLEVCESVGCKIVCCEEPE